MEVTASRIASTFITPFVIPRRKFEHQSPSLKSSSEGLNLRTQFRPFNTRGLQNHAIFAKRYSIICAAALNATCAAGQTQTVTRESPTITIAPISGKEKSPELDDGGTGFPPRDDGGGGGGGGGGNNFSGGFFFFGFLAFLGFLKDRENEDDYRDDRR
ncbi:hypothetical protein LIER_07819 [Lithospermum erythrorhizon]|uniref:Uncharacterized protein n=1 Tax=Lithospermum erythrorhizon TaxID=34254 RepID=A0AAV3PAK8_LITER